MLNFNADDLQDELLSLAAKIRDKGFLDEAAELENKYFQFKKAETHLYRAIDEDGEDLINRAHPDGDNPICDAQNGLGTVETLLSSQKKIHDVVKKKPTGKYAKEIKYLIEITAEVLGTPLTKKSQAKPAGQPLASEEELGDLEGKTVDQKNKLVAIKEQVEKLDTTGKKYIQKAVSAAGGTEEKKPEWFVFNPDNVLLNPTASYLDNITDGSVTLDKIKKYQQDAQKLYGEKREPGEEGTYEQVFAILSSLTGDPKSLFSFVSSIDSKLANTFLVGVSNVKGSLLGLKAADPNTNIDQARSEIVNKFGQENNSSIWELSVSYSESNGLESINGPKFNHNYTTTVNSEFLGALASTLHAKMEGIKASLVGPEKLTQAAEGAWGQVAANLEPLKALLQIKIRVGKLSTGVALMDAQDIFTGIIDFSKKNYPIISKTFQDLMLDPTAIKANVDSTIKVYQNLTSFLEENPIDPVLDIPVNSDQMKNVASMFRQIAIEWNQYAKEHKLNPDDLAIIKANFDESMGAYKALTNPKIGNSDPNDPQSIKMPFGAVRALLPPPTQTIAKTPGALEEYASKGLATARKYNGKNSAPNTTIDTAQQLGETAKQTGAYFKNKNLIKEGLGEPGAHHPPAQSGGGVHSPISSGNGLARYDAKSPDQEAVAKMQLALNYFGAKIANPENKSKFPSMSDYSTADGLKIIGTGPKSNPQLNMFDGKWGTNTNNALATAQKYLSGLKLNLTLGVRWDQGARTHAPDTVKAAEANAAALGKASSYLEGKSLSGAADDQLLDILGKPLDFSQTDMVQVNWHNAQNIKLFKTDLASFQSVFNFLVKNNLKQPESTSITIESESIEGFSFKTWNQVLTWFMNRARFLFEASKAAAEIEPGTQKSSLNTARAYYQAAARLREAFYKLVNLLEGQAGTKGKHTPDSIVDWTLLNKFIPPTGAASGGGRLSDMTRGDGSDLGPEGSGYSGKKKKRNIFDPDSTEDGGSDLEGHRSKKAPDFNQVSDNEPPIGDYINFNHPRWSEFDASQLSAPAVYLEDLHLPGKQMAKNLFGGKIDLRDASMKAVESLGKNPAGYNERDGVLVNTGNALVPATRFLSPEEIRQRTNQILQQAPVNRYKKFLLNLSASLHDVLRSWIDEHRIAPDESRNLQKWQNEWQRLIQKQLDDLSR